MSDRQMSQAAQRPGRPVLRIAPGQPASPSTVVLVLHGGEPASVRPVRWWDLAYLRMLPVATSIRTAVTGQEVAVWSMRYRVRGWNAPHLDPVHDVRWAVGEIRRRYPAARVVLVGHSMGGRAALHAAAEAEIFGVCVLAPWIEESDPVEQLAGRQVLIVHGDRDRITPAQSSADYVRRAGEAGIDIARHIVSGSGHAMLQSAGMWTEHVRNFVLELLH